MLVSLKKVVSSADLKKIFNDLESVGALPASGKFIKNKGANRGGQSFRRMTDMVHLRPKAEVKEDVDSSSGNLKRSGSTRSKYLSKFFDPKSNEKDRRKSKDELIKRGILKKEAVFGNELSAVKRDPVSGLPEFLIKCVKRLEEFINEEGIYRINGDAAQVQKIRLDVDHDNYKILDSTKDVTLLASSLKLFFRELPEPLISKETRDALRGLSGRESDLGGKIRKLLEQAVPDTFTRSVMAFLMLHLSRVSKCSKNKMDAKNLATVFSPNLVHSVTTARRPESIIGEMESNNVILEYLILYADKIFAG